ncbi:MAG TPA: hypothetical protein VGD99_11575, partial [Anaerolineae bacterium]
MDQTGKPRARYVFAITLALVSSGLLIWIIQLARQGEPVGYIILTGLGMLLALLVCGLVLRLLLMATNRSSAQPLSDLKTIYDTQRVLSQQNRALLDQLRQIQKQPSLLGGHSPHPNNLELEPGQMMTAEGFIIDGT